MSSFENIMRNAEAERDEAWRLTSEDMIEREQACGVRLGPVHRQWLLERAPDTVRRMLRDASEKPGYVATRQGFMGMDVNDFPPASFTPCTSTTGTLYWNATVNALTTYTAIPLNDPRQGKAYKVSFGGTISSSSSAPTEIWTPALGSSATLASNVSLGASSTITMAASLAAAAVYGEFTCGFRSTVLTAGGSTAAGTGFASHANGASAIGVIAPMGGTVPTTVDTTIQIGLGVWLTYGTAQGSNTATCQWVALQSLN